MKKLKLTPSTYNRGEVLTKAQLKKVMGGDGSGSPCMNNGDCGINGNCVYGYCSNSGSMGGGNSCQVNNGGCPYTEICITNAYGYPSCM